MTHLDAPEADHGPAARERLARLLRQARRTAGLSGTETGRRAGMSQSKVSKIERGLLLPSIEDVNGLCQVYEVDAELREELHALVRGLREEASARVILARGVAGFQQRISRLEAAAQIARGFQPTMIPGPLQTPAYARCVFSAQTPHTLSAQEIDEAVSARTARRGTLDEGSTHFRLILTEGALRWQAGSAAVMAEQVQVIAEADHRANVDIGVIPWTTPVRVFVNHGFHIYDEDVVIIGTKVATATLTAQADVTTYLDLFTALEEVASFGEDAHRHLNRIAQDYHRLTQT